MLHLKCLKSFNISKIQYFINKNFKKFNTCFNLISKTAEIRNLVEAASFPHGVNGEGRDEHQTERDGQPSDGSRPHGVRDTCVARRLQRDQGPN